MLRQFPSWNEGNLRIIYLSAASHRGGVQGREMLSGLLKVTVGTGGGGGRKGCTARRNSWRQIPDGKKFLEVWVVKQEWSVEW